MTPPQRGEVWLVDLGMTAKIRPCLVISIPYDMEERALSTIIPHTTSSRNSRFEVRLNISFLRQGVFDTQNILTIPNVKLIKKLGSLTRDDMISIGSHVKLWLGL